MVDRVSTGASQDDLDTCQDRLYLTASGQEQKEVNWITAGGTRLGRTILPHGFQHK